MLCYRDLLFYAYNQTMTERWLDLTSGGRIDLAAPKAEHITVKDIAGALSRICRFGGHSRCFYSVAQHAVLTSEIIKLLGHEEHQLLALHHDSHEAYVGDLPSPLKRRLKDLDQHSGFSQIVEEIDTAIGEALQIPLPIPEELESLIKRADRAAFQVEARHLLPNGGEFAIRDDDFEVVKEVSMNLNPLAPEAAQEAFLGRHYELTSKIGA